MHMTRVAFQTLLAVVLMVNATGGGEVDEILTQKKDLEDIQHKVDRSRQKLDSLRQQEVTIQKQVAENDQRIATNRKIVSRLNRQLKQLKRDLGQATESLDASETALERTQRRYLGNVREFYLSTRRSTQTVAGNVNGELELNRRVVYLAALAGFESANVDQAARMLEDSRRHLSELTGRKKHVSDLKKKKETATALEKTRKQKRQKELEHVRRRKSEEADHILTLELAAQEMERIIDRLERQRLSTAASVAGGRTGASAFSTLKGQLPAPCKGRVVKAFGHFQDEVTRLKSFSPGITIESRAGRDVVAVADGTVAYVGNLRGYDNFVIIDHGDQYYSTYGGLGKTMVKPNEYVLSGTALATTNGEGLVKFELRRGREPLDPVKWIRIDSF
ncbi:MAG: peptidoglycan DD-metalloendopeptidase family protein [Candidatus Zixiibacteriota bacterium]